MSGVKTFKNSLGISEIFNMKKSKKIKRKDYVILSFTYFQPLHGIVNRYHMGTSTKMSTVCKNINILNTLLLGKMFLIPNKIYFFYKSSSSELPSCQIFQPFKYNYEQNIL